jgi:hypothetical protein
MVARRQIVKGAICHFVLFFVNFCVMVGIIESFNLFQQDLPFLNVLLLVYIVVHTFMLLSIQLGIQVLELVRIKMPSFLIAYYFQFSDEELIPLKILDPTKSKLAVVVLLLVITGGPILYPVFVVYGFLFTYAHVLTIALDPSTILFYFGVFLNWMPPVIGVIVAMVIVSIVIIEFKHV